MNISSLGQGYTNSDRKKSCNLTHLWKLDMLKAVMLESIVQKVEGRLLFYFLDFY